MRGLPAGAGGHQRHCRNEFERSHGACWPGFLGHAGLVAIGADVPVFLEMRAGWAFLASLPTALLACGFLGSVLGFPALRLTGFCLAIVTMAFGVVIGQAINNLDWLTKSPGIRPIPSPYLGPGRCNRILRCTC